MSEPVHIIRFGLIKCEIHVRRTRVGECFNVTLSRLFRDGAVWRESKQLNRDDLLVASKILDLAHTWIYTEYRPAANEKEGEERALRRVQRTQPVQAAPD